MWSEEQLEQLHKLAGVGLSAGEIGARIGKTRNAVVGKCHRIGIPLGSKSAPAVHYSKHVARPKDAPPRPRQRHKRATTPILKPTILPPPPKEPPVPIEPRKIELTELSADDCKWPIGDGPFLFCGNPRDTALNGVEQVPYCFQHCRVAYRAA